MESCEILWETWGRNYKPAGTTGKAEPKPFSGGVNVSNQQQVLMFEQLDRESHREET